MNKTMLILLGVFLIAFQSTAQKNINVLTQSREVGKNLLTGEAVKANEFTFPERIQDFQIDTINNYLTIQLRRISKNGKYLKNKGHVVRYDTDERKVLWSQKIPFQVANIEQFGSITLHTTGGKSYCLNNETGEPMWEVKNSLVFADPIDNIGLGYKIQTYKNIENTLEGFDLNNGETLWQREINREYSWNNAFYLNDSTLLIVAAGLHSLNIFDGTGWDYYAVTGKKDYTAAAVGTGLGIAAGLLTGTFAASTGHNLVREVVSNVIVDSLYIYFASKEYIVKLNKQGEIVWKKPLPDKLTSKSWIFKSDENIIMVNRGYAYMGYRQLDFGTPFIASFNMLSGTQNYLVTVSDEKKETIRGLDIYNEELFFVFKDHIAKYAISTGQQLLEQAYNIEEHGELNYFIGEQVFVQKDSLFLSLPQMDSTKYYLYTKNGSTLILNSDLEVVDEMVTEDFYIYYLYKNGKKFIAKNNQTYVIDTNGKIVAEFTASRGSTFLNGKLYNAQDMNLLEIDIREIIQ